MNGQELITRLEKDFQDHLIVCHNANSLPALNRAIEAAETAYKKLEFARNHVRQNLGSELRTELNPRTGHQQYVVGELINNSCYRTLVA